MAISVVILGDIVGMAGCQAVAQQMGELRGRWRPDLVIANAENAADGSGLTPALYRRLCEAGVDGITLGDHVYRKAQIIPTLERETNIIRPANLPGGAKGQRWMRLGVRGRGSGQGAHGVEGGRGVYVLTVLGRVHGTLPADEPFGVIEQVLDELPEREPVVILEAHCEATSEKQAIARRFDGRVAVVFGTHTHVPTADARVLPGGTGYITDLGMCGPYESIIGRRIDRVVAHMTTGMPAPFDVATGDPRVCGVYVEIDEGSGKTTKIERIEIAADVDTPPFGGRGGERGEVGNSRGKE